MAVMSGYCKAYQLYQLREFDGWEAGRRGDTEAAGPDASVLYLHDHFVVTDGIFADENIVFDRVTPAWREFCRTRLAFQVPSFGDEVSS